MTRVRSVGLLKPKAIFFPFSFPFFCVPLPNNVLFKEKYPGTFSQNLVYCVCVYGGQRTVCGSHSVLPCGFQGLSTQAWRNNLYLLSHLAGLEIFFFYNKKQNFKKISLCVWRAEDSPPGSVFSLHCAGSRFQLWLLLRQPNRKTFQAIFPFCVGQKSCFVFVFTLIFFFLPHNFFCFYILTKVPLFPFLPLPLIFCSS